MEIGDTIGDKLVAALAVMMFAGNPSAAPGTFHVSNTEIYVKPEPLPAVTETAEKKPRVITMNVSAYTVAEGNGDGLTASGVIGTPFYTCASDDLPFGTKLLIDGRIWVVQDRFGGGYENRIDLLMETTDQCFDFGRQWIPVEIIE